jgi:Tfp pilus assembly protein PilV
MLNNKLNNKKTFTIIETLVTLLVVSIMIVGPVTFAYKSFVYSKFVKGKIEALSLSQEGLELATSLRNGSNTSSDFVTLANACGIGCSIDWNGESNLPTLTSCQDETCRLLQSSADSNKTFRHIGDINTDYYRQLVFKKNQGNSYLVTSKVWKVKDDGDIAVEVELKKNIFIYTIEY